MGAFKSSGHFWWKQCETCGMAWFVGDKPRDPEVDEECERCAAMTDAFVRARQMGHADGYAEAKAQAASAAQVVAARYRDGSLGAAVATRVVEDIRAMEPTGYDKGTVISAPGMGATVRHENACARCGSYEEGCC